MKNWKTTLAGLVAGLGLFLNALPAGEKPLDKNGVMSAVAVTLIGLVGKDHDKTGT